MIEQYPMTCIKRYLFTLLLAIFCIGSAQAKPPIHFVNMPLHFSKVTTAVIHAMLSKHFKLDQYRDIKVQTIYNASHQPDHLLILLPSKKFHHFDIAKIKLNPQGQAISTEEVTELSREDIAQQPGITPTAATCPDKRIEFIAFAPNNDPLEISIANDVATAAEAHGLKTVRLFKENATRNSYLNFMSCPNLKGNFYDGDSRNDLIMTTNGFILAGDIDVLLKKRFRYRVTNIWLACQAYNDPMKTSVMDTAQSQKYAAGINNLEIGPSDNAAACAMKAAIAGQPITSSFQSCYETWDKPTDEWGISGNGSEYFGV